MRYIYIFIYLIFVSSSALSSQKIAMVDVQKIIDNSLAVKEIRTKIDVINISLQKEFLNTEEELKKMENSILKRKDLLSSKDFQNEILRFNESVTNSQKITQEKKIRLEQAHAKAISLVNITAMEIIHSYAIKNNFDIVMPSTQVLYASETLNITKYILNVLNKKLPTVELDY